MKIRNERGLEQLLKKASSTYVEYEGKKIIEEANQLNKQSGEPLPENYSIDTENAKVEYVDINGKRAMYVEKEYEEIGNTNKLLWKENDYFIEVEGIGVTKEELVKVAESVKKN